MPKTTWKDSSSFSQGDTNRTPKEFTLKTKHLSITIHHYMGCGDDWFFSCRELNIQARHLLAITAEQAKREALKEVEILIQGMKSDLEACRE